MADPITTIGLATSAAGTLTSAAGTIIGAEEGSAAANSQAQNEILAGIYRQRALKMAADETRAASQRQGMAIDRERKNVMSRAKAIGAATGGGADPSVLNTIAKIDQEGEFQKAMALYAGENRAIGLMDEGRNALYGSYNRATALRSEAATTRRNAYLSAGGQILGGASTMFERYNRTRPR